MEYKFGSNSNLCLAGDLPQMLPDVITYGIQFDLNLYVLGNRSPPTHDAPARVRLRIESLRASPRGRTGLTPDR